MKRTDITELFPEATKEQIDKLMAINGADVNAAKGDVETLKKQMTEQSGEDMKKAKQQIDKLTAELNGMKKAETVRLTREKVAAEKNIPVNLLTGETEEACAKQADDILAFATPGYPQIPDGGESHGTLQKSATRDQFADWAKDILG